jgi:hypothetical protein
MLIFEVPKLIIGFDVSENLPLVFGVYILKTK